MVHLASRESVGLLFYRTKRAQRQTLADEYGFHIADGGYGRKRGVEGTGRGKSKTQCSIDVSLLLKKVKVPTHSAGRASVESVFSVVVSPFSVVRVL